MLLHRNGQIPRSNPVIRGNDGRWFVWLQIKSEYGLKRSYCFTFRSRTNVAYIAGMERVGVPVAVAQFRL